MIFALILLHACFRFEQLARREEYSVDDKV